MSLFSSCAVFDVHNCVPNTICCRYVWWVCVIIKMHSNGTSAINIQRNYNTQRIGEVETNRMKWRKKNRAPNRICILHIFDSMCIRDGFVSFVSSFSSVSPSSPPIWTFGDLSYSRFYKINKTGKDFQLNSVENLDGGRDAIVNGRIVSWPQREIDGLSRRVDHAVRTNNRHGLKVCISKNERDDHIYNNTMHGNCHPIHLFGDLDFFFVIYIGSIRIDVLLSECTE